MAKSHILVDQYEKLASSVPRWYMDAGDLAEVIDYYEDNGRHLDAECCLRQALTLHPDDEMLLVKKAYALRAAGQISEADAIVARLNPELMEVRFYQAEEALAAFQVEKADEIFLRMLREDSSQSPDWILRTEIAECYLSEGFSDKAEFVLREVPDSSSEAPRSYVMRAACSYAKHDLPTALGYLKEAIRLDPYNVETWSTLAEYQYESKHTNEAQEACQYALAINANDEKSLRISYFSHLVNKEVDEALQMAARYVLICPDEYYLPLSAGEVCLNEGRIDDALTYFARAGRNCPPEHQDHLRAIDGIAQVFAAKEQWDNCFLTMKCGCNFGYDYDSVCIKVATMALEQDNVDYASKCIDKITSHIRPGNRELCTAVLDLVRHYPVILTACKGLMPALQSLNTSIS